MTKIVISMDGGVIHSVLSSDPLNTEVILLDFDTEDTDDTYPEVVTLDNGSRVYAVHLDAEPMEPTAEEVYEALDLLDKREAVA